MQWSTSGLLHLTQSPGAEGFPPHAGPSLCPMHVPRCCVASCGQRGIEQNSQASKLFKNMTMLSGNPELGPFLISSVGFSLCHFSLLRTVRALLGKRQRGWFWEADVETPGRSVQYFWLSFCLVVTSVTVYSCALQSWQWVLSICRALLAMDVPIWLLADRTVSGTPLLAHRRRAGVVGWSWRASVWLCLEMWQRYLH